MSSGGYPGLLKYLYGPILQSVKWERGGGDGDGGGENCRILEEKDLKPRVESNSFKTDG